MSGGEKVGFRFTTTAEHEQAVDDLYKSSNYSPVRKERHGDGCVTFVFNKMSDKEMFSLINVVPHHYSALQAQVIGSSPPFRK